VASITGVITESAKTKSMCG